MVTEAGTTQLCTPGRRPGVGGVGGVGGTSIEVCLGQFLHGNVPDETGGTQGDSAGGTGSHLKVTLSVLTDP